MPAAPFSSRLDLITALAKQMTASSQKRTSDALANMSAVSRLADVDRYSCGFLICVTARLADGFDMPVVGSTATAENVDVRKAG